MLQIRLNKGPVGGSVPSDGAGSGSTGKPMPPPPESGVNVACPDHLVLADLPVAKSLGNPFPSALVKTIGRRSRRQLGERVHFCVRCDFPIAIYGRLAPCEHAFCLVCARSDSSCYLCDERIQKIQTIKMLEGIFICAAPHCLKSFLKHSLFEAHISETHADLLQSNAEKEEPANDNDVTMAASRPSSSSDFRPKLPILPEPSISHPHSRSSAPPSHNLVVLPTERDDKSRLYQPKEQFPLPPTPVKQPPQLKPLLFPHGPSQDQQTDSAQQMFDRLLPPPPPYNRFQPQQHSFEMPATQPRQDSEQFPEKQLESLSFPDYMPHQGHFPPAFPPMYAYSPMPVAPDGSQPFYSDTSRPGPPTSEGGPVQHGSVLGFPSMQSQGMVGFHELGYSRPWNMGIVPGQRTPYESLSGNQISQGINQASDFPGLRVPFFQGDSGRLSGGVAVGKGPEQGGGAVSVGGADYQDEKDVVAPLPAPPPLPLPPPLLKRGKFGGRPPMDGGRDGYGWQQNDKRGFSGNRD